MVWKSSELLVYVGHQLDIILDKISNIPSSPEEYFKSVYYEFIESAKFTVSERYDRQATGYRDYLKLKC